MSKKQCNKCAVGRVDETRCPTTAQTARFVCDNCILKSNFTKPLNPGVILVNPPVKDDRF